MWREMQRERRELKKRRSRWCKLLNFGNKKRSLILAIFVYSNLLNDFESVRRNSQVSCLSFSLEFLAWVFHLAPLFDSPAWVSNSRMQTAPSETAANKEIIRFRRHSIRFVWEYQWLQWLESSSFVFSTVVFLWRISIERKRVFNGLHWRAT